MSIVRPEVARHLSRWSEVLTAFVAAFFGLWLTGLGGLVMLTLGGIVIAVSLLMAVFAWRRMRFRLEIEAPGAVSIDEGRIAYLGPIMGGTVDLSELVEVEVIDVAGSRRCWRLRQADGQALLVPLASAGADALFDHLAALPGMEMRSLMSALDGEAITARRIWHRDLPPEIILPR
ncbi:hypothetical protein [Aliiruegeria lutimaris]|uniref:Uncharacterized protein n=1 Tax=Aliiruegeria lutimaris TaxID=571298 RepID=A0A1G9BRS5_9RHOB|nr:hypothetical protein [Aliiruegeria lutimaris]SDK41864.1 hypothetical protein SAMN04488026_104039 [Aliiruegeria lutimaris]